MNVNDLHTRFERLQQKVAIAMSNDNHTLQERVLKTMEEMGELAQAIKAGNAKEVKEEAIDLWLCAVSVMFDPRPRLLLDDTVEQWFVTVMQDTVKRLENNNPLDMQMDIVMGKLAQATLCTTGTRGTRYKAINNCVVVEEAEQVARYAMYVFMYAGGGLDDFFILSHGKTYKWIDKARQEI